MKTDSKTSYIVADEIVFMEVLSKKKEHLDHLFHVTKQLRINQLSKVSQLVQLIKNDYKKHFETNRTRLY